MRQTLATNWIFSLFTLMCLGGQQTNYVSISQLHNDPSFYLDKNVCTRGYLNFDRQLPILSEVTDQKSRHKEGLVLLDFNPSDFFNKDTGQYIENTFVESCGRVNFDPRCFAQKNGLECIPQSIYFKGASVKKLIVDVKS